MATADLQPASDFMKSLADDDPLRRLNLMDKESRQQRRRELERELRHLQGLSMSAEVARERVHVLKTFGTLLEGPLTEAAVRETLLTFRLGVPIIKDRDGVLWHPRPAPGLYECGPHNFYPITHFVTADGRRSVKVMRWETDDVWWGPEDLHCRPITDAGFTGILTIGENP